VLVTVIMEFLKGIPSENFENSVLEKIHAVKTNSRFSSASRIVSQAAQRSVKTVALLGE